MKDSDFEIFTENKKTPDTIRNICLKALSHYPELKNVEIEFKFNEIIRKSVMQAQPRFSSLFKPRYKRSYIIKISKYFSLRGRKTPIEELPEEVLIGWIGHELGHVMDYLHRSWWSMILFGLGYLTSKSFIISAERVADTYAVNHGLGDYILATKKFILHQAGMPERYIRKINKLYLPPEEIMSLMEEKLAKRETS